MNLRITDPSETPGGRFDAQLAALAKAREEGLIDGIGLSNVSRPHLLRAVAQTEIVCVQNLFNLADQRSRGRPHRVRGTGHRVRAVLSAGPARRGAARLLTDPVLATLAARLGATPAQVALAWLLDLAPNILLIPGTRTRAHLAENLGAADIRLDDAARAELTRHFPAAQEASP